VKGEVQLVRIERVEGHDIAQFRRMVEAYWQELMSKASVVKDPGRRKAYFQERFGWDGGNNHPHWAIEEGGPIGFMVFEVSAEQKRAMVNDFYVLPEARRRGYGRAMVRWLLAHLDSLGVEQIDLDVRRDNPDALAFWQAQGFRIALYRLRQYRDPKTGTAFSGALSSDF
jgi:ribosomal protein S18 acetylase RimI-like enzyme